jgi:hypothetical protein
LVAAAARWLLDPEPTSIVGIDETRFRSERWIRAAGPSPSPWQRPRDENTKGLLRQSVAGVGCGSSGPEHVSHRGGREERLPQLQIPDPLGEAAYAVRRPGEEPVGLGVRTLLGRGLGERSIDLPPLGRQVELLGQLPGLVQLVPGRRPVAVEPAQYRRRPRRTG